MFFIYIIISAAALLLIIAALLIKIRVLLNLDQNEITVNLIILRIIKIKRKYSLQYDEKYLLVLYCEKKSERRRVTALTDIILKAFKNIPHEITFVNLKNIVSAFKERKKNFLLQHLYKKSVYDIKINLRAGLGDALSTALFCGFLQSLFSTLYAVNKKTSRNIIIRVNPEFSTQVISVKANCIIALAPADIIIGYLINLIKKRR